MQESFTISDGIDGSATSYTITYTDTLSGDTCGRATIPASVCLNRMCSHVFEVSSSNCRPFSDINVTVFGTNILGNGTVAQSVTIGQDDITNKQLHLRGFNIHLQVTSTISFELRLVFLLLSVCF